MRYTILTKGDSKSNALKHKMINHMKDFQMVEDSENPEIVISVGEMERYYKLSINIVICYPKLLCRDTHRSFRILCRLVTP